MFADFQPLNQPHITTFSGCMVSAGSESEYEKYNLKLSDKCSGLKSTRSNYENCVQVAVLKESTSANTLTYIPALYAHIFLCVCVCVCVCVSQRQTD